MLHLTINPASPDEAAMHKAAHIIAHGGIAVYPTETVYGLAALSTNKSALERLFAAKGRRETKPVLLLIANTTQLDQLTDHIPAQAMTLAERWWPGPLTLLFKARASLSPYITGEDGKVACRISSNTVAQRLVQLVGSPITSTSANLAGDPSTSIPGQLPAQLLDKIDILLDAGPTPGGLPSTLLDVSSQPFEIVRAGAIPASRLL